jgi:Tol biopolymer transport system component
MGLTSGTRVGSFEILSPLGAGGMGEVYRARDTRLERDVAIKILPDAFARDPDRLARFEREARLLASLNHPHIAQIYGIEDSAGLKAFAMELVPGPTLAERIAAGPLSLDDTAAIAQQMAGALEAAHERGVIHRDLKPANVKLGPDGGAKVLDFGLAKLAEPALGSTDASAATSPRMTHAGLVLGTPAYMSPEQARGGVVDARTDLWAFGCVCFEMLSGRRAFDGATASDAIAAVLTREPDWSALPASTPESWRRLLRRCLARDPVHRMRHAGDIRIELDDIVSGRTAGVTGAAPPPPARRGLVPWAIAAALAVVALWLGWPRWTAPAAGTNFGGPVTRVDLLLPHGLELFPSNAHTVVVSPDGRAVAFVGAYSGTRQVYLRRLDAFDATPIRGTVGVTTMAFSPDGRSLAFVTAGGELRTVTLIDGLTATIAKDVSLLYGVAWPADGLIVFSRAGALWSTSLAGVTKQLTSPGADEVHGWATSLADGRGVLFTVQAASRSRIEALALESGERRVLLSQAERGKVGPGGRLFFYRDGRLLAVPFDQTTLTATGEPEAVLDSVTDLGGGVPVGDVSRAGVLVFPAEAPQRRLVWVTRDGVEFPLAGPQGFMNPRLSPDGTRIVVQSGAIWVHDLRRGTAERLPTTLDAAANAFPVWLPDGVTVMHRSGSGLRLQRTDGAPGRTLPGTTEFDYPGPVTTDGQLVFLRSSPGTTFDILARKVEDANSVRPLVQTAAYEGGARLSPDERWLVYVSNESGQNEVYVRPFGGPGGRRQVSSNGGSQPVWNPAGGEIFYRIEDRVMAVTFMASGAEVHLSPPRKLFSGPYAYGAGITISNYDVARDGQRLLMVKEDTIVGRLRVVLNWRPD